MRTGNGAGPTPTTERGSIFMDPGFMPQWADLMALDELEDNPKLTFPESVHTYHQMRTDPQVQGLLTGSTWPIMRMGWYLQPNGADDAAVEKLSADLNLPIGETWDDASSSNFNIRRTQHRFNFLQHLEEALDAIAYGFEVFEQVGYIGPDGLFHYRKLAIRPPYSIQEINLDKDGGIRNIRQSFAQSKPLRINRLVVYSFQRRGANWHGRSMLRGCYGPWLLKDRALRVGVMNIQRAGVGTPVAQGHPGATDTELKVLEDFARRFVAGDKSGGAIPYGATMRLIGVEGSQPDSVGFIKLMNEEMARSFFQMFMQLGQTTSGSRALGQTFVDYHKLVLEYIASWFAYVFNEHVIEDDIEWNYGEQAEYAPRLAWEWDTSGIQSEEAAKAAHNPTAKLNEMASKGQIDVSEETQAALSS
jgi:hypothetical protein